jgi:hypothetical protein
LGGREDRDVLVDLATPTQEILRRTHMTHRETPRDRGASPAHDCAALEHDRNARERDRTAL